MLSWESIELHVRTLIKNILEPTTIRTFKNDKAINSVRKALETTTLNVEKLDKLFEYLSDKIQTVDTLERRVVEINSALRLNESKDTQDRESLLNRIDSISHKFVCINDEIDYLKIQRESLRSEIHNVSRMEAQSKEHFQDQLTAISDTLNSKLRENEGLFETVNEQLSSSIFAVESCKSQINDVDLLVHKALKCTETNQEAIKKTSQQLRDVTQSVNTDIEGIRHNMEKSLGKVYDKFSCVGKRIDDIPMASFIDTADLVFKTSSTYNSKKKVLNLEIEQYNDCLLYTSPSPRDS